MLYFKWNDYRLQCHTKTYGSVVNYYIEYKISEWQTLTIWHTNRDDCIKTFLTRCFEDQSFYNSTLKQIRYFDKQ